MTATETTALMQALSIEDAAHDATMRRISRLFMEAVKIEAEIHTLLSGLDMHGISLTSCVGGSARKTQ